MKRTLLALLAAVLLGGLGLGTSPAAAYTGDNEWLSGLGRDRAQAPSRAERRTVRTTRATRQRSARRNTAATLPSLTGGSFQSGVASYYWQGQRVASGGRFNPSAMTAAHRTLPFGTRVRVTNHGNGRSVVVTINDRGPFIRGRVIDLSRGAAGVVGMTGAGLARVSLAIIGR